MKTVCFVLLSMLCVSNAIFSQSELKQEIEKMIKYDTQIEFKKTPGFLVHIIDGKQSYTEQFGKRELKTKDTLSISDKFQIGSLTKVFTSLLFQELVKNNVLSLDDPIYTYLDPTLQNPDLKELRIKDLLLHASDFPKRPSNFGKKEKDIADPYAYYSKDDLFRFYIDYKSKKEKEASYSHINYALLEIIAEQATQTQYEDLISEYILSPAEMANTGITIAEQELAPGYRKTGKRSSKWTFASFSGSEGMYSNISDLGLFLSSYLNTEDFVLSASIDSMLQESIPTKYNDNFYSGMGWQVIKDKTPYDIYAMAGTTDGHNAFIAMIRETKTAVIILSNSAIGTEDLGMQVLRMINNNWSRKAQNEQE